MPPSFNLLYAITTTILILHSEVNAARILALFPIPSISHQVVFREYTQALARQGHELVIVTPDPSLPKDRPKDNVTEIDIHFSYNNLVDFMNRLKPKLKRGVVADCFDANEDLYITLNEMVAQQFKQPEFVRVLNDKEHFDLIVVEALLDYPLILSNIINAPLIQISSFYGTPENFEAMGAISRHPTLHPHYNLFKFGDSTLFGKLKSLYEEIKLALIHQKVEIGVNKMIKDNFGPNAPTVKELKENIELLFVNTHSIFDGNRAVPPNVIYLGGLHMKPVKELPKDLKEYLDSSIRGVVYVSLGSNVKTKELDADFFNAFLKAFERLPYDIVWKLDEDDVKVSSNVKIGKWFPQRDLLSHHNIRAFVTQGGLQSTDEAIDSGVPLVGIPMLGDQAFNVNKYEELSIGVKVDTLTMTADDLVKSVNTVIGDKRYKSNILRLRGLIQDKPQPPLSRAVWWTEHVLRHRGAKHLRSSAANMTWTRYLEIEIILVLICVIFFIASITILSLCYLFKLYKKSKKNKTE